MKILSPHIGLAAALGLLLTACGAAPSSLTAEPLTSQALPEGTSVCFYQHPNYEGNVLCMGGSVVRFNAEWNDVISSVKVNDGFNVKLFYGRDFSGGALELTQDTPNLVARGFNDSVSSAKVSAVTSDPGGETLTLGEKCTPTVKLQLEDTDKVRSKLFLDVSGSNPEAFMQNIGRKVCRTLYKKASEVRDATSLTLIVRYSPGDVAWKSGDGADITVGISTDHLQNVKNEGRNVGKEIKGILFHEMAHMYQQDDSDEGGVDLVAGTVVSRGGGADSGLIEGIADTVRFKNGFIPDGAQPDKNGKWNDGYRTTAFFLLWLEGRYDSFIYKLNLSMSSDDDKRWSPDAFKTITGKSVDQLWKDYRDDDTY